MILYHKQLRRPEVDIVTPWQQLLIIFFRHKS